MIALSNLNVRNILRSNNLSMKVAGNLAEYLYKEVRVFCLVMTTAEALNEWGDIIMDSWGKRCNKILFFSNSSGASNSYVT